MEPRMGAQPAGVCSQCVMFSVCVGLGVCVLSCSISFNVNEVAEDFNSLSRFPHYSPSLGNASLLAVVIH